MERVNCLIWQLQAGKQMCSIKACKIHEEFNKSKHLASSRMLSAVYSEMVLSLRKYESASMRDNFASSNCFPAVFFFQFLFSSPPSSPSPQNSGLSLICFHSLFREKKK